MIGKSLHLKRLCGTALFILILLYGTGCATTNLGDLARQIPRDKSGLIPTMDEEHPECVERLLRISKFENIEIRFAHINDAGITQKFKSRDGQIKAIIYINPHLPSSAAICETLAHEIAHTLHPIEWVHPWREIFAEAVSHGVMKALGIDSTNQTIHYIAVYRNDLHILETKSNEISEAIDLILRETRPKHDPPPPSPDEEPPNDT